MAITLRSSADSLKPFACASRRSRMAMCITIFCSAALSTGCSTLRGAFSACPSAAVAHSPAAVLTPLPVCTLVLICGGWFVAAVASGIHWRLGRSRVGVAESMAAVPLLDGRCCAAYRALLLPLPGRKVASPWWIASSMGKKKKFIEYRST